MNCMQCQENISSYIDNELDEKTKKEVTEHLDICQKCRSFYKSEYLLKSFVHKRLTKVSAPDDLKESIRESIRSDFPFRQSLFFKKRIFPYVRPLVTYAVAAVLVVFIVTYLVSKPWQQKQVNLSKILLPDDFTYVSETENKITLTGTIVCVCCEMKKSGAHTACKKFGHVYGLKTDNGVLWTIMKNDKGMEIIDHNELIGTRAKITGWFFFNSDYIDLEKFEPISFAQSDTEAFSLNK